MTEYNQKFEWLTTDHLRLEGAVIAESLYDLLVKAKRLTLVSCSVQENALRNLAQLDWLIIFKGGAKNIDFISNCTALEYLEVNQVRGLEDISAITSLRNIKYISLYGLPKITALPALQTLHKLRRLEIGSMRNLENLIGIYDCESLQELFLLNKVGITHADYIKIKNSPFIHKFDWVVLDGVATNIWEDAIAQINKPKADTILPEDWFANIKY